MWLGVPQSLAESQAVQIATEKHPASAAVVHRTELAGCEWVVYLWLIARGSKEPQGAVARVRATDGSVVTFEEMR